MIRLLYKVEQYFKLPVKLPRFIILFSVPHFPFAVANYKDRCLTPSQFCPQVRSLHILNRQQPEPYWWYMHDYKHYECAEVVLHSEGHNPPRFL